MQGSWGKSELCGLKERGGSSMGGAERERFVGTRQPWAGQPGQPWVRRHGGRLDRRVAEGF